jgi:hypothetical protein
MEGIPLITPFHFTGQEIEEQLLPDTFRLTDNQRVCMFCCLIREEIDVKSTHNDFGAPPSVYVRGRMDKQECGLIHSDYHLSRSLLGLLVI